MKRPPLLSDEQIHDRVDEYVLPYQREISKVVRECRTLYEAARAKDAELIEIALGYVKHGEDCGTNKPMGTYGFANGCSCGLDDFMDVCASAGFTASNP